MMDKKFILYWMDGRRESISGSSIGKAFSNAGYGQAATEAVDFYTEGEVPERVWDSEKKAWIPVDPSTIPDAQFKLNEKYDLDEIMDENNRESFSSDAALFDLELIVSECKKALETAEENLLVYKNKQIIAELGEEFILELAKIKKTKGQVECLKTLRALNPVKYDLSVAVNFVRDVFE